MYGPGSRGLHQCGRLVHAMAEIWGKIEGFGHLEQKLELKRDLEEKTACPDMSTVPQSYTKNHRFSYLEPIWNGFGRSKCLVIWAFGHKNEL